MNYAKPEVAVLGRAVSVIEQFPLIKGQFVAIESLHKNNPNPAYDLDE